MRLPLLVALAATLPLAGCMGTAEGVEDPFAYMRKPLYASSFDLAETTPEPATQEFRVQDGSVVHARVQVWVNATAGGATVSVSNPSGRVVATLDATGETTVPVELGVWRVEVAGQEGSVGRVDVRVDRA